MDFTYNTEALLQEIVKNAGVDDPSTDSVRIALNKAISSNKLTAKEVLMLLARLSAAWIHRIQRDVSGAEAKHKVEDFYNDALAGHLGLFEYSYIQHDLKYN